MIHSVKWQALSHTAAQMRERTQYAEQEEEAGILPQGDFLHHC
jgi:hypothetical protein